jgi:cell division transport system ATP-binding protein
MIGLQDVDLRHDRRSLALTGLTFSVPTGGFRWLTGAAGAGKSTLLALLAARLLPERGRVGLLGHQLERLGPGARARLRRRIGLLEDERRLLPHLSALENVALPLRIRGVSAASALLDSTEMLEWVGLGAARETRAGELSRGERLACALARAVVGRPELLLADEPAEGLGETEGGRLFQLLLEMNRLGATVVVATRSAWLRRLHDAPTLTLHAGRLTSETA